MTLHLEIITPERIVLKEDVDQIIAPTANGQITILPNHINLLTSITPGELITKIGGKDQFLAVMGGFLQIADNNVTILPDFAVLSEEIEIEKAEEAKKRAQKLMEEKGTTEEFAEAEALFKRSLLELKVAARRKHHQTTP